MIVQLSDETHDGFGEATANPYYDATVEQMSTAIEAKRAEIESHDIRSPEKFWDLLHQLFPKQPFPVCALDQAAHDLWGKKHNQPVYQLWGLNTAKIPQSNFTIGIDQVDVMIAKLQETPDWPIYKIKLGTDHDIEIVRALRQQTDAIFRVDANCGWKPDETVNNSKELKNLGVEFIEQPLSADDREGQEHVYENSVLPIIADESCIVESDVDRCFGLFHGINIKLVKCGGLTPARRMIHRARELDMRVMVGCMTESTVGISAIAQLLPLLDYVDMDGAALLAKDIATGVQVENGTCIYPDRPGHGVALRD